MIKTIEFRISGDTIARESLAVKLRDAPGVDAADFSDSMLRVAYDLRETNCAVIVERIEAAGLAPALSAYQRFCLGLRCYREAVLKDGLSNEFGWDSFVREIYVSRYRHRRHGRRDDRPRHWRQYTAPASGEE